MVWMIEMCYIGMGRGKRECLIYNFNKLIFYRVKLIWFDWDFWLGYKEILVLDCVICLV